MAIWTNDEQPADAKRWLEPAHAPRRQLVADLDRVARRDHGSKKPVPARAIKDGIEPAPGRYAMMP